MRGGIYPDWFGVGGLFRVILVEVSGCERSRGYGNSCDFFL